MTGSTTVFVRDTALIQVRVPERGQPGAGAILKVNGAPVDATKSLNLINPGMTAESTGGNADVTIPYSGSFRGNWDMSSGVDPVSATIPTGALDLDSFKVTAGGFFHGKTTRAGDYVQLINGKTDLIIDRLPTVDTVNNVPPVNGNITLTAADLHAVSYDDQTLTDAQKRQAQRNLGTQVFIGADFPTGTESPAILWKYTDGNFVDVILRVETPIWHGHVSSLMFFDNAVDSADNITWTDSAGFIYNGALRPDGRGQTSISRLASPAKFDLSNPADDCTIELFYTPSAGDNDTANKGILSINAGGIDLKLFLRYAKNRGGLILAVYQSSGNAQVAAAADVVLTTGTKYHIAIQRISGAWSIAVAGVNSTTSSNAVYPSAGQSGDVLYLGQVYAGGYSEQMTGVIWQWRFVNGVAVYPSYPFTPPTSLSTII